MEVLKNRTQRDEASLQAGPEPLDRVLLWGQSCHLAFFFEVVATVVLHWAEHANAQHLYSVSRVALLDIEAGSRLPLPSTCSL
jgi:hypothetical protein